MMIQLPKVRRDGKQIDTVIDAMGIKGIEPKTFPLNGVQFNGSKVYANNGSFYVAAHPMQVAQAKHLAITTGEVVMLTAPQMQMIPSQMVSAGGNVLPKMKKELPALFGGAAEYKQLKGG